MASEDRIKELAQRTCARYRHHDLLPYQFNYMTLVDFVRAIEAETEARIKSCSHGRQWCNECYPGTEPEEALVKARK